MFSPVTQQSPSDICSLCLELLPIEKTPSKVKSLACQHLSHPECYRNFGNCKLCIKSVHQMPGGFGFHQTFPMQKDDDDDDTSDCAKKCNAFFNDFFLGLGIYLGFWI